MSILRVYFDAPPDASNDVEWALFDAGDRVVRSGRSRRTDWPAADSLEGIAAGLGRLVTLTLPLLRHRALCRP
jgi:hypothetical protein